MDRIAMTPVLGHGGVAGIPVGTWFRIEPDEGAGVLGDFPERGIPGRSIIIPGVTGDDDRRSRRDLRPVAGEEDLKTVPVVGMAVHPHDFGLGGYPMQRRREIDSRAEIVGHFVNGIYEGEGAKSRKLSRHRMSELQGKSGECRHRT